MRAQVVVPGGVLRMAALGRHDDDIAPVLDVDQRRGAPGPALGADMVEQQHRRRAGEAMADESAGRAVDERVASHQPAQHRPGPVGEAHDVHPGSLCAQEIRRIVTVTG